MAECRYLHADNLIFMDRILTTTLAAMALGLKAWKEGLK